MTHQVSFKIARKGDGETLPKKPRGAGERRSRGVLRLSHTDLKIVYFVLYSFLYFIFSLYQNGVTKR